MINIINEIRDMAITRQGLQCRGKDYCRGCQFDKAGVGGCRKKWVQLENVINIIKKGEPQIIRIDENLRQQIRGKHYNNTNSANCKNGN